MRGHKVGRHSLNVPTGFPNDLNVSDYSILYQSLRQEVMTDSYQMPLKCASQERLNLALEIPPIDVFFISKT